MTVETKAMLPDGEDNDGAVAMLREEVAALGARMDAADTQAASRAARLPLDGVKSSDDGARRAFIERYLRRGIDAGVEMKALSGVTGGEGGDGWRGAVVEVAASESGDFAAAGQVNVPGRVGTVLACASEAQAAMIDCAGWIDVMLANDAIALTNLSDTDLLAGGNLAMVGQELIQFGHADPQGGGIWRLTRLLRGRLGTEDAMAATTAGDGFAMIDNDAALPLPRTVGLAALSIGGRVRIAAPGGAVPVELAIAAAGRSARPLSPVHLAASHGGDGRITLRWTIRSRAGFGWDDGSDALPDGAVTGHIVDVVAGSISARFETGATQLVIDAATVSAWRASAPTALVAVRQTAAGGESVAAETIITL